MSKQWHQLVIFSLPTCTHTLYVHGLLLFSLSFPQFFVLFALGVHLASYKALEYLARPYLGPNGELLEAGTDLAESYFSE